MIRNTHPILALPLVLALTLAPAARAEGELYHLSYSGRLLDAAGAPLQGPTTLRAVFYRSLADEQAIAGVPPKTFDAVPVQDGLFSIAISLSGDELHAVFPSVTAPAYIAIEDVARGVAYPRQRYAVVPLAAKVPVDDKSVRFDTEGRLTVGPEAAPKTNEFLTRNGDGELVWKAPQASVTALQGATISTTAPAAGQALVYDGAQWKPQAIGDGAMSVSKAGDTMAGVLAMGGNKITGLGTPTAAGDAATKAYVDTGLGGKADTAANIGTAGVGVFKQKTAGTVELRKINAGSTKVTVALDAANNEVDVDVAEGNLTLDNLGGTLGVAKGGTGATTAGAGEVFAGPAASSGAPDFRALVGSDLPAMTGDAGTGGAKGAAPAPAAGDAAAGKFLKADGTWQVPAGAAAAYGANASAAADSVFVDADGKVGIGTTMPDSKLEVVGAANNGANIFNVTNTDSNVYLGSFGSLAPNMVAGQNFSAFTWGKAATSRNRAHLTYHHFGDGSTSNRMTLDFYGVDDLFNILASGYVGVGTAEPEVPLQVVGRTFGAQEMVRVLANNTGANTGSYISLGTTSSVAGAVGGYTNATFGGNLTFLTRTDGEGTLTEKARLDQAGNLGIGTPDPVTKIDVRGVPRTNFPNTPMVAGLYSTSGMAAGMGAGMALGGNAGGAVGTTTFGYVGAVKETATPDDTAGRLVFGTRAAGGGTPDMTRMVITSEGKVGIGTLEPESPLWVQRTASSGAAASIRSDSGSSDIVGGWPTLELINGFDAVGNYASISFTNEASGGNPAASIATVFSDQYSGYGDLVFLTRSSGGGYTEKVRIDEDGNVGIGTADPKTTLDVNGLVKLAVNGGEPATCDLDRNGAVALTSKFTICACKHGTGWVSTIDGIAPCDW